MVVCICVFILPEFSLSISTVAEASYVGLMTRWGFDFVFLCIKMCSWFILSAELLVVTVVSVVRVCSY